MTEEAEPVRLGREFFARPVLDVARELLGCELAHAGVTLRITETEAYAGGRDPAARVLSRQTRHNAPVFGAAGHLFVYFTYGHHWMACIVSGQVGEPDVVLLRAGEVLAGQADVQLRRGPVRERDWCRGPGRLAQALALTGSHSGLDVCRTEVRHPTGPVVTAPWHPVEAAAVRTGPRVGVRGPGGDGTDYPWRFWLADEPSVSAYRAAAPRTGR
ncbi:3-methyladenine DNA glycosylase [Humibacillus sp. DSM 29435]|uniref:DNA-3-methyladenine glycosylase n=1 Tax=Humibacillus sp. DSM 29435 TaxID=1869167 RepID=UPI0008733D38|nr:DNA-3-methyladenine glycosylase [Humibacillus sp. DSM 29435]OFE17434.1 3-methyladenine DNA glycosylase [Humibacillus sp. DSM 29435]